MHLSLKLLRFLILGKKYILYDLSLGQFFCGGGGGSFPQGNYVGGKSS